MDKPLAGRLALVTGASRGIGAATAEALAAAGAHVILVARTTGGLEETEDHIHAAGGSATIAPLDLTEAHSIARLAEAISGRWSQLDVLVLNAAMLGTLSPVPHVDAAEFDRVMALNLQANQRLIAAFDPMLRQGTAPRVIALTSSVSGSHRPYWGAYAASKAALETLVLTYAEEVKNLSDIKVMIVDPGATATTMRARAFPGEDPSTIKSPGAVGKAIAEIALSDFETGHRMRLDG